MIGCFLSHFTYFSGLCTFSNIKIQTCKLPFWAALFHFWFCDTRLLESFAFFSFLKAEYVNMYFKTVRSTPLRITKLIHFYSSEKYLFNAIILE